MTPREIILSFRALILGYFVGYLGLWNCLYLLLGYILYTVLGLKTPHVIEYIIKSSGKGLAILINTFSACRGSPFCIDADKISKPLMDIFNYNYSPYLKSTEKRIILIATIICKMREMFETFEESEEEIKNVPESSIQLIQPNSNFTPVSIFSARPSK